MLYSAARRSDAKQAVDADARLRRLQLNGKALGGRTRGHSRRPRTGEAAWGIGCAGSATSW
jgi:hypothetical protein